VTGKAFVEAWNEFFFAEQSPIPIALFRILYGMAVLATLCLSREDWIAWYGPHAWVSLSTMQAFEPGPRLNLFTVMPASVFWVQVLFWVFVASTVCLTIGFLTRLNSVVVYVCLASIQQRNLFILHGGDTFLRVAGFFLIFSAAGAALSVDRLIRIWRGKEGVEIRPRRPWAQRMIQLELSLVYFVGFCWKVAGAMWVQGTALSYIYRLDELQRFPLPSWFLNETLMKLATWFTLVLEFALGVLLWIREIRYYLLAIGLVFHLSIEYSMNIPMFQWDVLTAYVLFIDAADLKRVWNWISNHVRPFPGERLTVIYDGSSQRLRRVANLLGALDIFGRLRITDARDLGTPSSVNAKAGRKELVVVANSEARQGLEGMRRVTAVVPLMWPLFVALSIRRLWAS
jgi:hypothetical protein